MNKKMNIYPPSENLPDLPDFAVAAKDEHRANSFALSRQSSADEVSAAQQEDPFADLQSLWDEQTRRIDHLLAAHPEARPARLNLRHRRPWRRRVMTEYLILIILNVAAGIYTLFALLPDPYILIRITGIVLASTNAILALHSLYFYFVIRRHHPARVSVARMSRFIRRMHMEPHYAPRPDRRRPRVIHVDFRNAVNTAISSARQVAAVSAAALAVRYGALLHGPYVNRNSDTLWNPLADDSLYSFGVCGIGRDDSLSLFQPRSVIRNGILTLESVTPLSDLEHIMLGCDSNSIDLSDETVIVDTISYLAVARQWKLRAHTYGHTSTVRLTVGLPLPADAIRLMLTTADGSTTVMAPDSTMAFTLNIANGQDYFLSLLVNPSGLPSGAKGTKGHGGEGETASTDTDTFTHSNNHTFSVSPNPSSGHYTVRVAQSDGDIINIRVVDANGRIVEQHSTSEPLSQYTYNGHLSADGIYYVTVTSNGRQQTIKLIVVR